MCYHLPPNWHPLCKIAGCIKTKKEAKKMKMKIGAAIVAGTFFMAAVPMIAAAGPAGKMNGQTLRTKTQSTLQIKTQQRLRDGSCLDPVKVNSGTMLKKGNTYGPGDGTGNLGVGPKDGTGYGAPSQR